MHVTMTERQAHRRPLGVSNRKLIECALLAGCKVGKTRGETVQLRLPDGTRMDVHAPGSHMGNPASTFKALEDALGADRLWASYYEEQRRAVARAMDGIPDPSDKVLVVPDDYTEPLPMTVEERLAAAKAASPVIDLRSDEEQQDELPAAVPTPREEEPVQEASTAVSEAAKGRNTGASNKVLEALIASGTTMTSKHIAEVTGLTRQQASSAAHYLTTLGLAERVKNGAYKLPAEEPVAAAARVTVDVKTSHGHEHPVSAPIVQLPVPQPALTKAAAVEGDGEQAMPVKATEEVGPPAPADEDTIGVLIDVLFPDGFRVTSRNLRALDEWRAATMRLLEEVEK